jgi:ankyrin repeat protein
MANKQSKTKKSKAKKDSKKRSSRRNKTQAGGNQELISAVMFNHTNTVYSMVNNGADVNYMNNNTVTPLRVASRNGNMDIVRFLLDHGAIVQTPNYVNALDEAAREGHIDVASELLDRGADPSRVDSVGVGLVRRINTGTRIAKKMVNLLIDKGFRNGYYTREHAERDGVLDTFDQRPVVIESNGIAEVFEHERYHHIPGELMQVIRNNFGGKRKTKKSKAKKDSKKRSSRRNKTQAGGDNETEDEMLARVQKIYDEDGDINELNKADRKGKTPLHYASEKGYSSVVEDLIQYTAVEINKIREKTGKTALHYASENGHWEVVAKLVEDPKIDVNIQDNKGKTPLHYAYHKRDAVVIDYLLRNGGDLTIRDKRGKTPVDYRRDLDTISGLLRPGSSINGPLHNENDALVHSHVKK